MLVLQRLKQIGPGAMVAAAFIGPGTVTTATIAGAGYGYTLLWAVVFSTLATMVLQEMAARLGVVSNLGLGQAIRKKIQKRWLKVLAIGLVLGAVLVGNAAYEAGNIAGAAIGFDALKVDLGEWSVNPMVFLVGILAFTFLYRGSAKILIRTLVVLVSVMGCVFLVCALLVDPPLQEILSGMFTPEVPAGSIWIILGLIGTTVVPYNLFLHASMVKDRWEGGEGLKSARLDTFLSVALGGLITMAILICASAALYRYESDVKSVADLAAALSPLLGHWSPWFISIGFFAAGLSSAITAPLAAAHATSEILDWQVTADSWRFRRIWLIVLLIGILFASLQLRPTMVILFAQSANGILLPIMAIFLLWIMNDIKIMGSEINNRWSNILGVVVVLVTILLGGRSLLGAFGWL